MVEQELIDAFSKLEINEQRNQINSELEKLGLLLDYVHKEYNIEKMASSISSYDIVSDQNMKNEDYFKLLYKNIIFLRKDVLTLVNFLLKDGNSKIK